MQGLIQYYCKACGRLWNYPKSAKRPRQICPDCCQTSRSKNRVAVIERYSAMELALFDLDLILAEKKSLGPVEIVQARMVVEKGLGIYEQRTEARRKAAKEKP